MSSIDINKLDLIKTEITNEYKDYVTNISSTDMATSFEQCALLIYFLRNVEINSILDTGSGISSYFIRRELKNKTFNVTTFETNKFWLEKTKNYLIENNLNCDNLFYWDDIKNNFALTNYDFIYHDLGCIEERIEYLPNIVSRLSSKGTIMLDDLHFNVEPSCNLRDTIYNFFKGDNWQEQDIKKESIDCYGRYATIFKK